MFQDEKVVVVMPAYNAAKTLEQTYREIPFDIVDNVVLVDDASQDNTLGIARKLGLSHTIQHPTNRGYGGNQKTCYATALSLGADIVIMLHPDYQYTPKLIHAMASLIGVGQYDIILASRILGDGALEGGMPFYKYIGNRFLTGFENYLLGKKLSEYHTGYRAFSKKVLESLPLEENSDDFVFDNEILAQAIFFGFRIGEISCPTRYIAGESSSISLRRSITYGFGVIKTSLKFRMQKMGLRHDPLFSPNGRKLCLSSRSPQR
ncbi:MAG: glycosyltransferase family 2 protein [bacterium]